MDLDTECEASLASRESSRRISASTKPVTTILCPILLHRRQKIPSALETRVVRCDGHHFRQVHNQRVPCCLIPNASSDMGKSVRKYRKNRDYDSVAPPSASSRGGGDVSGSEDKATTSAYAIIDASKRVPGSLLFAHHYQPYSDDDLLTSPHEFVPLSDLAPGDCGSFHVLAVLVCACVGPSGALAMPFAFLQGGFLLTNVLLAVFAVTTVSASVWLVHLGVESGSYSLHGVSTLALGRCGAVVVSGIQFVVSAGRVLAGFLLLFDDLRALLARSLHFNFDAYGEPIDPPPSSSAVVHAIGNLLTDRVLFAELIVRGVVFMDGSD